MGHRGAVGIVAGLLLAGAAFAACVGEQPRFDPAASADAAPGETSDAGTTDGQLPAPPTLDAALRPETGKTDAGCTDGFAHDFCASFDGVPLDKTWHFFERDGTGIYETSSAFSPPSAPSAFLTRVAGTGTNIARGYINVVWPRLANGAQPPVSARARIFVETGEALEAFVIGHVLGMDSPDVLDFVGLVLEAPATDGGIGAAGVRVVEFRSVPGGAPLVTNALLADLRVPLRTWTTLEVDISPRSSTKTGNIVVKVGNATQALDIASTRTTIAFNFSVGVAAGASWSVRYDDVAVDFNP